MPGLYLVSGNRLEILAEKCGSVFKDKPLPPMNKEIIVVQSLGMMQWLSIKLAEQLGIWADFEYVLPNRMTGKLMKSFFPDLSDERFFEKDIMTWKTMRILRENAGDAVYRELRDYISNDNSGIREYQISGRIADLFDQYMTFRPDMILKWDKGEAAPGDDWQPHLWRKITGGMSGDHPPALLHRLFAGIESGKVKRPGDLPQRISVFGVSYLPLYHLNVLRAVSNFCDLYIYMLNPCRYFWSDIMGEKEITRLVAKKPVIAQEFEEQHIERGNPLLSSMGRAGRDFFRFLYMSDMESGEDDRFDDPGEDTLLHIIQHNILNMTERGKDIDNKIIVLSADAARSDKSVVINSCHSIMREVEVLHDYLLDLFDNDKSITPADVLVMTPDIESFSSIIQGVFDRREENIPRIPYRILDRKPGKTSKAVDAFMKILSLAEGRFTSGEVMAILQCPAILEKFELSEDDFDNIGSWVRDTGIFWGIDADYKKELELPAIHENTWSFGLERMLLGAVMKCEETVFDALPYPGIEGYNMQVLGKFMTFFRLLCDTCSELVKEHTPGEWSSLFTEIVSGFFEQGTGSAGEMLDAVKAAARLREIETQSGFTGITGLLPVKEFLENSISIASAGKNFITGNLTFCEMLPMRSIPCKVICLIGMNEYSFPRKARPSGFDLMMKSPRMGDRSVRDEDRYLFLETLISARERIYISYTGQNITTNTDQNPSIVVSELLDCIEQSVAVEGGKSLKEYIFRKQRLQSYHPVYFTENSGYYSYSPGRKSGADSYLKRENTEYSFFKGTLPALTEDEKNITIGELAEFLINPSKYVIRRRLGVNLEHYAEDYSEEELFIPDNLQRYQLDDKILRQLGSGYSEAQIYSRVKADGSLPHGTTARVVYNNSLDKTRNIFNSVNPYLVNMSMHEYDLIINDVKLKLRCPSYNGKFIFFRAGKLRPEDRLRAWLHHLAACCSPQSGVDFETRFTASDKSTVYKHVMNSGEILGPMIDLYKTGMMKPVPLFPAASYEFAFFLTSKDEDKAAADAFKKLKNPQDGDLNNPYAAKIFGDSYRPDNEFIECAKTVYSAMIDNDVKGE